MPNPVDFDTLPIPFRAVTGDLETGEAVVFSQGDISRVIRASMSVPGAFAPVEIDGRLLVDGLIVNNVPIKETIDMGADVLIVVTLHADMAKRKDLTSLLSISGQMISILLSRSTTAQLKFMRKQDIMVTPNVTGYTPADFPKGKTIMDIGEEAARNAVSSFSHLSLPPDEYEAYLAKHSRGAPAQEAPKIEFVRIENNSVYPSQTILKSLQSKEGDAFDRSLIEEDVQRLYDSGHFANVEYTFRDENGKRGLVLDIEGNEWYEKFFRIGALMESDFDGNNTTNLAFNYRINKLPYLDGYLESEVQVGSNPSIRFELYEPIVSGSQFFIAPEVFAGLRNVAVRSGGEEVAQYQRQILLGELLVGRGFSNLGEAVFGYRIGSGEFERDIGDPALPDFDYDIGELLAKATIDTLDSPDFPTSGYRLSFGYTQAIGDLGDSSDFTTLGGSFLVPFSSGRDTLIVGTDFSTALDERPAERSVSLGGFFDVSGFQKGGLFASDYIKGGVILFHRFTEIRNPVFHLDFFGGVTGELTSIYVDTPGLEDETGIVSGSVFLGADTPLVPMYLGFGLSDLDEHAVYFALGRIGRQRF